MSLHFYVVCYSGPGRVYFAPKWHSFFPTGCRDTQLLYKKTHRPRYKEMKYSVIECKGAASLPLNYL